MRRRADTTREGRAVPDPARGFGGRLLAAAVVLGLGLALGALGGRWLGPGEPVATASAVYAEPTPPDRRTLVPVTAVERPVRPYAEVERVVLAAAKAPTVEARRAPASTEPSVARQAATAPGATGRPLVAIIIDDLGHSAPHARRVIALPPPLTLAFLPYGRDLPALANEARRAGHELLVHIPMEAMDPAARPGPEALRTGLDEGEILRRLRWNLSRFSGYVGVNNHMGSRFSADAAGMGVLMGELKRRGLLFVDSRTSADTVGADLARRHGVPQAERDVFLDDEQTPEALARQFALLERTARERGAAIAIGHPHEVTLAGLARWRREAEGRGIVIVPVSAIIARRAAPGTEHTARTTLETEGAAR